MSNQLVVLLIDDEIDIRVAVDFSLGLDGFKVLLAEDGPTGLKIAQKKKPHLILLDVMMPEMDGWEVLAALKQNNSTSKIPVFMLTSKNLMSDVEHAYDLSADDYITKPFDVMKLGPIIKRKLGKVKIK